MMTDNKHPLTRKALRLLAIPSIMVEIADHGNTGKRPK
jgi:hypothetical protein